MAFFCCSPLMTGTAAHRWDGQTSLTPKMEKQHATEGQEGGVGGGGHGAEQRLHSEATQKGPVCLLRRAASPLHEEHIIVRPATPGGGG